MHKMAVLPKTKSDSDAVKVKRLKNIDQLAELPLSN